MSKPPSWNDIRASARRFAARYQDSTDEQAEKQPFWIDFLGLYGIDHKRVKARFEDPTLRSSTGRIGWIDFFWPGVIAVEHKSAGKNLEEAERQCLDYLDSKTDEAWPQAIVTSDFKRIRILDLMGSERSVVEFALQDLPSHVERFGFLAGYAPRQLKVDETAADVTAARLMGRLFEEVAKTGYDDHETSILLTRLLFLLFGDDTGLWERDLFAEFVATRTSPDGADLGSQLAHLFEVLDRAPDRRLSNLDELLARFPHVNGGLFADHISIPAFDRRMREELLAACNFAWGAISPAIFGSLFQAVKSKEARRALGEHYTSEANIRKVIDPLFLDDLRQELDAAGHDARRLRRLRDRLGKMRVLDPACGCGNFLVVAYKELRGLELEIMLRLREITGEEQLALDATLGLRVSPTQFSGIEFEEWPARIAETAMFLADHQENLKLANHFGDHPDRLPIQTRANVVQGNALRIPWDEVSLIDADTRIVGNPPFLGSLMMNEVQKEDARGVWGDNKRLGTLDYVTNWFVLGARWAMSTGCRVAFVSTNSVTQGEQVGVLWAELAKSNAHILFAHQTFAWTNESPGQAAVHVVVIGLAASQPKSARLFEYPDLRGSARELTVLAINPYLYPGDAVVVQTRSQPLSPEQTRMRFGSMPRDGGALSRITPDQAEEIRGADPIAARYLRRLIGAEELISGEVRYCLWLVEATPHELRESKVLRARLEAVAMMRRASKAASTRRFADTPWLFAQLAQPTTDYLAVPRVSSESRRYVPMAMFPPEVIASDALLTVSAADTFTFGAMSSSAFNEWNRVVSGRLKSDMRISAEITYHNFPFPEGTEEARAKVGAAAADVLAVRAAHPRSSLADLYDVNTMPPDLQRAHRSLDRTILESYGLVHSADRFAIMTRLFELSFAAHLGGSPGV